MATYNQNFQAVNLTVGSYTPGTIGNGVSASTIHQVVCLSPGVINIVALGGGAFSWTATTVTQSIDVLISSCQVLSGAFVGFKAQKNWTQSIPYFKE